MNNTKPFNQTKKAEPNGHLLVTTELEETWGEGVPVLFLGEWCRRYSRKNLWERLDATVLPYHWENKDEFYVSREYLIEQYEILLKELSQKLNALHGENHTLRYWRILVGPWLWQFTYLLFDHWQSIHKANKDYNISETIILPIIEEQMVPNDIQEFTQLSGDTVWNHFIYGRIISNYTNINVIGRGASLEGRGFPQEEKKNQPTPTKRSFRERLVGLMRGLTQTFVAKDDIFIFQSYLPIAKQIELEIRFRQIPQVWKKEKTVDISYNSDRRRWKLGGEGNSGFEKCAREFIPNQIPKLYLEGYEELINLQKALPWPTNPKVIWTSNAHAYDDLFKIWAALKVESNSRLVIGQHGGFYGIGLWSFWEDHEINIADSYLTWGWTLPDKQKVVPIGYLKESRLVKVTNKSKAVMVTVAWSRFMRHQWWLKELEEQYKFVEFLPKSICEELIVRVYPTDGGNDQELRWKEKFPNINVDNGESNLKDLISNSKIFISTYNATTYIETFKMDVPTILYWDSQEVWRIREAAQPYFDELKSVGIFHEDPKSAARHLSSIWDNIDEWWSKPNVRAAVSRFCNAYASSTENMTKNIKKALCDTTSTI